MKGLVAAAIVALAPHWICIVHGFRIMPGNDAIELSQEVRIAEAEYAKAHGAKRPINVRQSESLPQQLCLSVKLFYNNQWNAEMEKNGSTGSEGAKKVFEEAKNAFKLEGLGTTVNLMLSGEPVHVATEDALWEPSSQGLEDPTVTKNVDGNSSDVHHYAFLTAQSSSSYVGIANLGTVCLASGEGQTQRTSITAWSTSDQYTAYTLAHEIGHALGINHDFVGDGQGEKQQRQSGGTTCSGIMDYTDELVHSWSPCSQDDLKEVYQQAINDNGEFCLASSCGGD